MTEWSWPGSRVVRVIDGDSFVAELTRDLGFNGLVTFRQKLRLNRINTPPVRTAAGTTARVAATALLMGAMAEDFRVDITTVGPYKYGDEWMAEVLAPGVHPDDRLNVSDELVRREFAVYWDGKGPRPGG